MQFKIAILAAVLGILGAGPIPASAENDFYSGKTITMVIGDGVGGSFDADARVLTRHLADHIPGKPAIVVQNMEGASGLAAANYMYNTAAKNGTVISATANTVPLDPLFADPAAHYDSLKLNWLGSIDKQYNVCFAWYSTGFKTLQDVMNRPMHVSATGAAGWRSLLPTMLNSVLHTKFEVINGYSSAGAMLAIERGEVEGMCADYASLQATEQQWLQNRRLVFLAQFGLEASPDLAGVPMGMDFIPSSVEKSALQLFLVQQEFGRPYLTTPGVPADRIQILRNAFDETMRDPFFISDAKATHINVAPLTGATMEGLIDKAYASDPQIVETIRSLVAGAGGHR